MYSAMTPEVKAEWQDKAEKDKTRYLSQISKYVPPPGYDARGDAVLPPPPPQFHMPAVMMGHAFEGPYHLKPAKKVKCRDPHAPKRNLSAYLLYQNAMRDQFKSDNPGMTFGQLSKYTSHMYRSLTPQEKAQWEARSIQDKARFDGEMSRYIPPPGFDSQGILIDTHTNSSLAASHVKKVKKPRDPNAPKRARGSYVFFTNFIRPIIMKEKPDTKFVELGALMGERWRSIAPEEKLKFEALANEDRNRFNRDMEEYNAKKAEEAAQLPQMESGLHIPQQYHQNMTNHHAVSAGALQAAAQQQQQQQTLHHHQHMQENDTAAAMLGMLPNDQGHQQVYQQNAYMAGLDPTQVYSNQQGMIDPSHFNQFSNAANQMNTRGV